MPSTDIAHADRSLEPDRSLDLVAAAADSSTVGAIELVVAGLLFALLIVLPAAIVARDLRKGRADPGLDTPRHEGVDRRRAEPDGD
jgi:hypothetical protein